MQVRGPFLLVPNTIGDTELSSSTVAEPAAGETAWASGGTYVVGDERIRVETHRVYTCIKDATGRTVPPEDDPMYWLDTRATARWEMFDDQVSTQTKAATTLTVVVEPGFSNAIALYNITGANIEITVKDATGGTVIKHYDEDLYEPFQDWYEWLFSPYKDLNKIVIRDIFPYDTMEYTITVTGGGTVGIGMCVFGDMRPLITSGEFGGPQYGTQVKPIDYSYIKTDDYGNTKIVKRRATTDVRATVVLPTADAEYAINLIQEVLATPVAFVTIAAKGYDSANVFGLISGDLTYQSAVHSEIEINVKGLV